MFFNHFTFCSRSIRRKCISSSKRWWRDCRKSTRRKYTTSSKRWWRVCRKSTRRKCTASSRWWWRVACLNNLKYVPNILESLCKSKSQEIFISLRHNFLTYSIGGRLTEYKSFYVLSVLFIICFLYLFNASVPSFNISYNRSVFVF